MSVIPQAQKPEEDEPDEDALEDDMDDDPEDFELPMFNKTGLLMGRVCAVDELLVGDELLPVPLWETPEMVE